jgi:hypothetical protein
MQLIKRADKDLYNTKEPLTLSDGTTISRCNNNVGLNADSWITVQKNYTSEIIPFKEFMEAQKALDTSYPVFQYELVSYNKSLKKIKFAYCPNFDTRKLPEIHSYVVYDFKDKDIEFVETEMTQAVFDKWLLVKDDYTGFNVQEAYERSRMLYENL